MLGPCLVKKLEEPILAVMSEYGLNRVQLPLLLHHAHGSGLSLGHGSQRITVKCAGANWRPGLEVRGVVQFKKKNTT